LQVRSEQSDAPAFNTTANSVDGNIILNSWLDTDPEPKNILVTRQEIRAILTLAEHLGIRPFTADLASKPKG
jgi:hypothetical protein